ncbi:MAG: TfoX/Sxy family protein [Candidatus Pacebacteria bacterium]|nr:TfoX/Sxy family protein [Candidatus Paceibacterota bacterium]
MSAQSEFTEYVLELLEPLNGLTTARMFGGVLLKVEGEQLGVLFGDTVYFKVKEAKLQERYKGEGSKQFTYTRKDKKDPVVIKNWWSVPEYAMDSSSELVRLAEEILVQ